MELNWANFKQVIDDRALAVQYARVGDNYYLKAIDGQFELDCLLTADSGNSDTADFEANYKPSGNQSPKTEVVTQFEKRDKTLKICSGTGAVGIDGIATVLIKVPGTHGSGDGRWISSGMAFFDVHHPDDKVNSVRFTDEDNILGYGAGFVVGSYTDDDADSANQGWHIPPPGWVEAEAIGGYGFAPSGFYIKVVGTKGGGATTGNLYMNIEWGKNG